MEESPELESDDEALSFSDLPVTDSALEECDSQWKCVQSPRGSPQGHFEFSRSNSMSQEHHDSSEICPADDLFYNGQLLPLGSSLRSHFQEPREPRGRGFKSSADQPDFRAKDHGHCSSLDSQCSSSSYWGSNPASSRGSRSSGFSDSADRNAIISKAESIPSGAKRNPGTENRLKISCKTSNKWRFFTLGLIKTPEMRLDDIRLRSSYGGMDRSPRPANPGPNRPKAPAADNDNNNHMNINNNVPSDWKRWRMFRSMVSYRIGCRDSSGVSAPRKPNKCSGGNGDNGDIVHRGSGEIFYSAELNLRFVSGKKNCRDYEGSHQTKGSSVPNFISSAISLCKQCHAVEPDIQRLPKQMDSSVCALPEGIPGFVVTCEAGNILHGKKCSPCETTCTTSVYNFIF